MPERRHQGLLLSAAVAVLAAVVAVATLAAAPASAGSGPGVAPAAKHARAPVAHTPRSAKHRRKLRQANRRQKRPNVVVIETDDQNDSLQAMPNTQALLSAQGTTFRRNYASFPLCCPSRATFLTGQYAHNHGVRTSDSPAAYNSLNGSSTLPVWLRSAGYRTAMIGKYLNGYGQDDGFPEAVPDAREVPKGWSDWVALTAGSDQRRYSYKLNEDGDVRYYGTGPRNYLTDVLATKAVTFIKKRGPRPKPYFLWFTPTAPHGEAGVPPSATRDPTPAPRHFGLYGDATAPHPPNWDEADVSDKPEFVRSKPPLSEAEVDDIDRRYRGRMESLRAVDDAIKRIVGKVRKTGDMRKTYFIFTSDNGLQLGAHRLIFKAFLYEESTRVPLIIRGPGFPAGVTRDQLVSNVDLAPTITNLAKARPGLLMDGRSLVPFAANPAFMANRDALLESYQTGSFAIRQNDWIYTEHNNGERELYDLATDPYELTSLHEVPARAPLMDLLREQLQRYETCAGAACP